MTTRHAESFGIALKQALDDAGLSQRSLALHLGKSDQTISDWAKGKVEPPPRIAIEAERYVLPHLPGRGPGFLTIHLGFLPPDGADVTIATPEDAIIGDGDLDGEVKRYLLGMIRRERRDG